MNATDKFLTSARRPYLPQWARDDAPTTLQEDYEFARQEAAGSVEGADLIDELVEVQDAMASLARAGDHEAVGFVVCAVFDAYVKRLADREVFGKPGAGCMDAKTAALDAMRNIVRKDDRTRNALVRAAILANAARFA